MMAGSWCVWGSVYSLYMKIISFNARGLGGRVKKKEVKEMVKTQRT